MPAYKTRNGISLWKEPPNSTEALSLPCGGCIGCRKAAARAWALRCHLELQQHEKAAFTTLTYDDEHLPPTLRKRDLQLFLKRLRKRLDRSINLRFFASGEYGEHTTRPHFHAILYGLSQAHSEAIHEAWRQGYTRTDPVTPERIAYTAGYCSKKIGFRMEAEERINYTTGEVYHWQPPFLQMSRRPGIGGHARQHFNSWRSYAIHNGAKLAVPRFLRKAWDELASPEQQEHYSFKNYQSRTALTRDTTPERLAAAEQIAVAQQAIAADRRKI